MSDWPSDWAGASASAISYSNSISDAVRSSIVEGHCWSIFVVACVSSMSRTAGGLKRIQTLCKQKAFRTCSRRDKGWILTGRCEKWRCVRSVHCSIYEGSVLKCVLGQKISVRKQLVGSSRVQVEAKSRRNEIPSVCKRKVSDLGMYLFWTATISSNLMAYSIVLDFCTPRRAPCKC